MRLLVTAGPTREAIDPVRFISNRSSGKMGYAVAAEAVKRGHEVVLVSGPVSLEAPAGVSCIRVVSAAEMMDAVMPKFDWCDAAVMTAAVADWRPRKANAQKLKKSRGIPSIELEATKDILAEVCRMKGRRKVVGFAAETTDCIAEGARKLREKGADLMVVNDVTRPDSGFETDTNKVTFIHSDGTREDMRVMPKSKVAGLIIDWIESSGASHGR